jgi:hypothetical protein
MRKALCPVFLSLALCAAIPARAEEVGAGTQTYTWDSLATIGGATSATVLIVQFLKSPLDRLYHFPTRYLALLIAFGLLTTARAFTTGLAWLDIPLILVNSFVVALAAMGAYEVSFAKLN